MAKRLLIIATLDTKGREAAFVVDMARGLGFQTILMDIGTLGEPVLTPDISRDQLASAAQRDLNELGFDGGSIGGGQLVEDGGAIVAQRLVSRGGP